MKTLEPLEIKRGDIIWIACDPSVGAEPRKTRTCVVVSNDLANRHGATVTVVPTLAYTKDRAARPFMADLRRPRSTMDAPRVANASLVTTYDRRRVAARAGRASPDAMQAIDRALLVHLGLATP
ncbi:MAG TPA: type II toxin-antitoxin system PemK/MazF family toxin [Polyangia bacterium]|jgi:mRNA interferase MazF